MKKRWVKIVCTALALMILSLAVTACDIFGGSGGNGGTEVPFVEINRVAPNNLDLPGIVEVALATPGEGALLVNENAKLWVPPGAVAEQTPVTITKIIQHPVELTSTKADAMEVQVISEFYDLGPDNASFDKPVEITLFYSEEALPAGADENNIGPVYFDGQNWVPVERQLDTEVNSVTFKVKSFPGVIVFVAFGIQVGWPTIVAAGAAIGLGGAVVGNYVTSPLVRGKANEYVTPEDSTVLEWADKAKIIISVPYKEIYIKDLAGNPSLLKEFLDADHGQIKFENPNNASTLITPKYVKDWPLFDIMQKPADYFNNGMNGDCEDISVAIASIFRHYGYQAKCVDGYRTEEGKTGGHAWAEIIIDGKPYYLGETGLLEPLDVAIKDYQLERPTPSSLKGFAWDEKGQKPYVENWWDYYLEVEVNQNLAIPGGEVIIDVFGPTGVALDIELTLENPAKAKKVYKGVTDKTNGEVRFTLPLAIDAPLGIYTVTAYNAANKMSEVGVFSVTALEMSAILVSSKVEPGEMLEINVKLNKPLATDIWVNSDTVWPTDAEGSVTIYRAIPQDTPLGPYTLTLSIPAYKVSKKLNYAVWLPATLRVNITPEKVAPGGKVTVNVLVDPAQPVLITMQGYSGQWTTGPDGGVHIPVNVSQTAAPGVYKIVVQAPDLGLSASDTYTVQSELGPEIGLEDVTAIMAQLTINAEGEDEESYFEMKLILGGQFVRTSGVNGDEIFASGTVGPGEMYYSFTLNKDLTAVTSGVISLVADTGAYYEARFSNVPMNADYEVKFYEEYGVDALIFVVKGMDVSSHLSSIKVNEPSIGTFNRFFAKADSELVIILAAATESQLSELLGE